MASVLVKTGGTAYGDLVKRLRKHADGKELERELKYRIHMASGPAVREVQSAVMRVDVKSSGRGGKSSGLRRKVANATGVATQKNGIRIRIVAKKVDPKYGRSLARHLDAAGGRALVHPVFGNQENQETQIGEPFFAEAVMKHEREFRAGAVDAMVATVEKIRTGR